MLIALNKFYSLNLWFRISVKYKYFITRIHKIFCHIFTYKSCSTCH